MERPQIVFIGSPSTDRLVRNGQEREAVGGAAFISALAACVSGARTGLVARIPPSLPDAVAQCFGPGGLMRAGLRSAEGQLPSFRIVYDENDRAHYTHVDNGLEEDLSAGDVPEPWLAAPWIHLAAIGEDASKQLQFLVELRQRGFRGQLSAGIYRRMIDRDIDSARVLMADVDLFFCNEEEYQLLCPDGPPESVVVCVTRGSQGVEVVGGMHAGRMAAPPVEVVDATGAGDSFCGGFLAALMLGTDPVRSGIQAASMVLTGLGSEPLCQRVVSKIRDRVVVVPDRIDAVAQRLSELAEAATFDFTHAPHLPVNHPYALPMLCISTMHQFGFWNSDPISGWQAPMYAELDGVRYKGSDFIWAAFARAARTHPEWFSPRRMAEEPELLRQICTADDGHCPLPEVERYQALHQAHGRALCEQWPGGYSEILADCNAHPQPVRQLLGHLRLLPGYAEDPMAKKANLLAIILGNRPEGFLRLRDPEHIRPIVDYHLMRGCLRTGCVELVDPDLVRRNGLRTWVDAVEEQAIRAASMEAIDSLVRLSGTSVAAVDGFFFSLGRRRCLETESPHCSECPIETVCGRNVERFQPVFRTSFY